MPVTMVKYGTIRADPALSDPGFLAAYEWLERELGFFPLFCAVGTSDEVILMTGYDDNWRVVTGGRFVSGEYQKIRRKKGEFPNLAIFSFDRMEGVFMDYMSWHIALNSCVNADPVSNTEKRQIFKPSWTKCRWIRAAVNESHMVQLVTPALPLREVAKVQVRNNATKRFLEKSGFQNVEIARFCVHSLSK